jgi:hypothetical protein
VRSTRLRVEICCFMICDINMTSIYDIDIWHQYDINMKSMKSMKYVGLWHQYDLSPS